MAKKGESEKKPFCNCVSVIVTHLGDYSEKCYQVTDGQGRKGFIPKSSVYCKDEFSQRRAYYIAIWALRRTVLGYSQTKRWGNWDAEKQQIINCFRFNNNKEDLDMKQRKVKMLLKDGGEAPVYATPRSSGADVRANETFTIQPNERKMIHTGIYMQLPEDMEVQVRPRSGLAMKHGITCVNAPGTIDSDYQGECNILLINHGDKEVSFEKGERIAQFVFVENVVQADFEFVEEFSETTERGAGGFGHTGTK